MRSISIITLACAASATAQSATVVVEASHGGAGSDLSNTTITVPLNTRYKNDALAAVSSLYLTGANGVPLDTITCQGYRGDNLTAGLPFTSTKPSSLSTNTVAVEALICRTSETSSSSSSSSSSVTSTLSKTTSVGTTAVLPSSASNSTTSRAHNATSVLLTTVDASVSRTASPSTLTSTEVFTGSNGRQTSTITSVVGGEATTSASPSLNSPSAAGATAAVGYGAALLGIGGVMAML